MCFDKDSKSVMKICNFALAIFFDCVLWRHCTPVRDHKRNNLIITLHTLPIGEVWVPTL